MQNHYSRLALFTALVCLVSAVCQGQQTTSEQTRLSQTAKQEKIRAEEQFILCRTAAEQGDAAAQYRLGLMYDTGSGGEQNHAEAIKWYCKSAEQGNETAQSKLIYEATVQGDVVAQCSLGVMSENGRGVAKNSAEAVNWYRKAAEQGDAIAQCRIGWMYQNGQGVEKDDAAAAKWYKKSAEQGNTTAKFFLCKKVAEQGDATSQYNLGVMYQDGQGVEKNDAESVVWFSKAAEHGNETAKFILQRKAAEQGDAKAQFMLGFRYDTGQGVEKDEVAAVKWYRKAAGQGDASAIVALCRRKAEQGDAAAQYNLGYYYGTGQGVEKNEEAAAKWYCKAAEQGDATAQYNLSCMYANGQGVARNIDESFKWCQRAANQGLAVAQSFLGTCYENGYGVLRDHVEALKWYRKAAAQGDATAQKNLDAMAAAGRPAAALSDLPAGFEIESIPASVESKPQGQPKKDYSPLLMAGFALYILALIIRPKPTTVAKSQEIGGWLLFFCVTLVILSPIFSLGKLEVDRQQSRGACAQYPALSTGTAIEAIGIIAVVLAGVVFGLKIWRRDPNGVRLARRYLQIRLFTFIGAEVIALCCLTELPKAMFNQIAGSALMVVIREVVIVGVWWLYFSKSKRVKETYNLTKTAPPPLIEHPDTTGSPPLRPPPLLRSENKKEKCQMNSVKRGVLTGAIVFTVLLVMFWPTLDTERKGYGDRSYTAQCVNFHGNGPLCLSYVFGFAMLAGMVGLLVGALSGRKQ